ncbi:MAG: transketolase [Candidatus Nealsonbacteria bacterium]|nr:transketolase [Candidatus Nealsonbacteria bacterium]
MNFFKLEKMDYNQISKNVRRNILKMFFESQTAHLGSCLSVVDILSVLYFKTLSIDVKKPLDENRDRFILSKGHAVAALYAVLSQRGFFPIEILDTYCKDGSKLPGHSTKYSVPGIEASTGSLGHGLSMGAGIAIAAKKDLRNYRVFVLMSDGECEEGSVWEAAMFASHHKLDNLIGIVDYNKLQAFGRTNEITALEPLRDKWLAFGWQVKEINGHNFSEIQNAFSKIPFEKNKPSLLIANTVKGKGISFMEDKLEWHYKNLNKEDYKKALKELD